VPGTVARRRELATIEDQPLQDLLTDLRAGRIEVDQALDRLRTLPFEDLGFARVDHHRLLRKGMAEVVFGQGKTAEQIAAILATILDRSPRALATRVGPEVYEVVRARLPDAVYHAVPRAITVDRDPRSASGPGIAIVSAGTSDLPIAEEAALTATLMGRRVERLFDVGVSGLHRLLPCLPALNARSAIVVVAGMDGVLPSVIGGLVAPPVIAVPTSVGYGASFGGLAPLLTMLNSCAAGVAVVNIDNGFGAGYMAALIDERTGLGRDDR
jgi:NCAIR mutase (PurE)-related protein